MNVRFQLDELRLAVSRDRGRKVTLMEILAEAYNDLFKKNPHARNRPFFHTNPSDRPSLEPAHSSLIPPPQTAARYPLLHRARHDARPAAQTSSLLAGYPPSPKITSSRPGLLPTPPNHLTNLCPPQTPLKSYASPSSLPSTRPQPFPFALKTLTYPPNSLTPAPHLTPHNTPHNIQTLP